MLEDLKIEKLEYLIIVDLRKEFGRENNKTMKVAELKKVE